MTKKITSSETIKLAIPADVKYLETVSTILQSVLDRIEARQAVSQAEFGIKLAVHEACVNIIEHAYHGNPGQIQIEIQVSQAPPKIVIELTDQGDAAVESNFVQPNLDEPQIKGYGLFLIRNLVDEVKYVRNGGSNQWRLVKTL